MNHFHGFIETYISEENRPFFFGWLFLWLGFFGLIVPFLPGWLLLFASVAIFSLDSPRLRRYSHKVRRWHPSLAVLGRKADELVARLLKLHFHHAEKRKINLSDGGFLTVVEETSPQEKGIAVVVHGVGGYKEQSMIEALSQGFKDASYSVVRFDARHSFGESSGDSSLFTVSSLYEDLEKVVDWTREKKDGAKVMLAGHSAGGMAVALYVKKHPAHVAGMVLLAPLVSGTLSLEALREKDPQELKRWKSDDAHLLRAKGKPGKTVLPWSHMEDRLRYDLLIDDSAMSAPALIIAGGRDRMVPNEHVEKLLRVLQGEKEYVCLENASHLFKREGDLANIEHIVREWVERRHEPQTS
jgi:pimeloyl-ACP methyl ester carboxylesterase